MFELSDATLSVLLSTTAAVAVAHAFLGIDHSLPFIAISKARGWSLGRTLAVTSACGVGHVMSSVVIGGLGAVAGTTFESLAWVESSRGQVAAALLIGFGLSYAAWAIWQMRRGVVHTHEHHHANGTVHTHVHDHHGDHLHVHAVGSSLTPWALFVVLLLGPCEPLIPLMMVPAMGRSWVALSSVVVVFGLLTIGTMVLTVAVGYHGLSLVQGRSLIRYADPVAGLVVAASGAAVLFLGL